MKSILITGATGFVGRKLVKLLENYVYKISVLSRQQHPDYKTFVCDLAHEKIPTSVISSIDTIFHLAGIAHNLARRTILCVIRLTGFRQAQLHEASNILNL